ncbi:MAG TPA: hypothetical protein VEA78_03115 [Acidimicrobiales bacterium]|nr:hypothetical protein [Acidimicrobiales bacterium]
MIATTLAVAALVPACDLGEKERWADVVISSVERAIDAGTVRGTISASMRVLDAPLDLPPDVEAQRIEVATTFVADLAERRSLLEEQQLVHDDLIVHLRRADAEENDARPWLSLDVDDLGDDAALPFSNSDPVRMPYTMFALPPAVLVDLVAGALTGSLESVGAEDIDGVAVQGYRANFDLEKMLGDTREDAYDEEHREAVERMFGALDVDSSVHPGEVWLDDEGRPRRIELELEASPRRRWTFGMTVTVDLLEWGVPAAIDTPTIEETIRISSINRLMTELARSFPAPDGPALPVTAPPTTLPAEQPSIDAEVDG